MASAETCQVFATVFVVAAAAVAIVGIAYMERKGRRG